MIRTPPKDNKNITYKIFKIIKAVKYGLNNKGIRYYLQKLRRLKNKWNRNPRAENKSIEMKTWCIG